MPGHPLGRLQFGAMALAIVKAHAVATVALGLGQSPHGGRIEPAREKNYRFLVAHINVPARRSRESCATAFAGARAGCRRRSSRPANARSTHGGSARTTLHRRARANGTGSAWSPPSHSLHASKSRI